MRSKAHLKGHPLHPILVAFPIAFFSGALIFDILGIVYERNDFHATAIFLTAGGIGFALLAAIPGVIDYLFTVPPKSSAKKRATKHGLTNICVVIIFSMALLIRQKEGVSIMVITGMEALGFILLLTAGWMGGTLVYRNQIGVDPRYAHAGKWKEEYIANGNGRIELSGALELKTGQMKLFHIENKRIVLCRTENGFAAFDDHCTHRGGSLAGGALICGIVQCPWHGSQFDVMGGTVQAGPAKEKIRTYRVVASEGKVFVTLEPA